VLKNVCVLLIFRIEASVPDVIQLVPQVDDKLLNVCLLQFLQLRGGGHRHDAELVAQLTRFTVALGNI
jgi:hypothetical protein